FAVLPFAQAPSTSTMAAAAFFVWPFLFDTSVTLVRRVARGEHVMRAHRTHLYQRLIAVGLSHAQVSPVYAGLATLGLPAGLSSGVGPGAITWALGSIVACAAALLWGAVAATEAAALGAGGSARRLAFRYPARPR